MSYLHLSKLNKAGELLKIIDKRRVDNHLIAVKSKLIQSKKNSFFKNWVKELRKGAYIEIFDHKL
jgi:hypothetical protein